MSSDEKPENASEQEPVEIEEEVPEPPPHGRIPPEEEEPPATGTEQPATMTLADLSVYDTLRFMVSLLSQQAWLRLGLQVVPGKAEPEPDLPQARVAIDSLEAVIRQLEPHCETSEKQELETLLGNLRINYVKKAG